MQGGLEIPCEVTVEMEMTDTNSLAIDKYKQLVSDHTITGPPQEWSPRTVYCATDGPRGTTYSTLNSPP